MSGEGGRGTGRSATLVGPAPPLGPAGGRPGVVALVGGHEHTPGCEAIDRALLRASGVRTPEVAVLLAASPARRRAYKVAEAETYWTDLGARARCAFAGEADPLSRAADLLAEADLVVLTGGRPWLAHERVAGPLGRLLCARWRAGVPVAGSSAGAMLLAGWTWTLRPGGPFAPRRGLGLVPDVLVAPHAGRHGVDRAAARTRRVAPWLPVLLVPDRTAVLVDRDGRWNAVGVGSPRLLAPGTGAVQAPLAAAV